ncbi:MAG: DUF3108 domain-containing protein [Pseudomonadota bacterium]|nr:hypothetical protein [Burkholderiales bacterium]MDQ3195896.1 DUF3108 domain-containing protein [Pseudomonadota bacterium]
MNHLTVNPRAICGWLSAIALAACASTTPHGELVPAPAPDPNAVWSYQVINAYNGLEAGQLRSTEGWGLLGDTLINRVEYAYPEPAYSFPLQAGRNWTMNTTVTADKRTFPATVRGQALGWERIKVPAGEFDTLKIRRQVYLEDDEWWRSGTEVYEIEWYAPELRQIVRRETRSEYRDVARGRDPFGGNVIKGDWNIVELMSYRTGKVGGNVAPSGSTP